MSAKVILETRNLCKHFRPGARAEVRAVQEISLSIEDGSFTVLTGPSGSGKTTLLSLLGALDRPSSGKVLFQGRDLSQLSDMELARVRRRMGFVFQNFSLIPKLPVWENVTYPLIPRGFRRRERWAKAQELLRRLGLSEKTWMYPQELSGGEQQRVGIARALADQPQVILADEPISSLDRESGRVVMALLEEIHSAGKTVILSVHDPALISRAGRIYELEAGKLKSA